MPDRKLDAIIFIPGLGDWIDQSVDGIARRIATALDRNAQTAQAQFNLKLEARDEEYASRRGLDRKARVRAIFRNDGGQDAPVLDVYELEYRPTLTKNYAQQNALRNSARLFLTLATNFHRLLQAVASPVKGPAAKAQLYFALFILSLLVAYMAVLIVTAVETLRESPQVVSALAAYLPKPAEAGETPPAAAPGATAVLSLLQTLVVAVALVQTIWPGLREGLIKSAVTYISVIDYLSYGDRREVIAGQVSDLLEHVAEKGAYRRIHIVAYSFGSLVALDNVFPLGRKPGERFKLVHTLVTIGCPFDIVRMFWPNYFQKRQAWPGAPQHWYNLYLPIDVLGSNFRDGDEPGPATKGIELVEEKDGPERKPDNLAYTRGLDRESLSPLAWLALTGLRAHANYWEAEYESEMSCFSDLTLKLYAGDPLLQ